MGIEVSIRAERTKKGLFARFRKPEDLLGVVEHWCRNADSSEILVHGRAPNWQGQDCLFASLHPASELLKAVAHKGAVHFSVKTSTVGPGFHDFVVRFLEWMARDLDLKLHAEAETDNLNYLNRRDFEALRREMLSQLGAIAGGILRMASSDAPNSIAINLGVDRMFESLDACLTPMGPRNREWIVETAKSPVRGVDIWPWYNQGKTAEYHRDLAIALMWTEVPWRAPLDDNEAGLFACVLSELHCAHDLEPSLQYPWREWAEMLTLTNDNEGIANVVRQRADAMKTTEPLIGYRRYPVYHNDGPGGWQIRVPGGMQQSVDEAGDWHATDGCSSVRLSSVSWSGVEASLDVVADALGTRELDFKDGDRSGVAGFISDEEDGALILRGGMLQGTTLAMVTISSPPDTNRETMLSIWHSLRNSSAQAEE